MNRIPLNIVVTETGATTPDVLTAVMVSDLDALEAENARLSNRLVVTRTALTEIAHFHHGRPEARFECNEIAKKALEAQS